MNRREALRWGLGLGLLASSGALLKSLLWPAPVTDAETGVLLAFGEALLPPAALSRGGLNGMIGDVVAAANSDRALRRVLRRGVAWIEDAAGSHASPGFSLLTAEAATGIVAATAAAEVGSVPRVFYERLRLELFARCFARPQVLAALGLPGPPQPGGYPDYTRAP